MPPSASSSAPGELRECRSARRLPRHPRSRLLRPVRDRRPDYVDGGVGFSGHADLAAEAGADVVFVVNPLVPNLPDGSVSMRARGVYTIMEQAGRIYGQNLLHWASAWPLSAKYPPDRSSCCSRRGTSSLLFGRRWASSWGGPCPLVSW